MKEIRHILGGWLFAPAEAYNYYAQLHNELCDLEDRTWEKKRLRPVGKKPPRKKG